MMTPRSKYTSRFFKVSSLAVLFSVGLICLAMTGKTRNYGDARNPEREKHQLRHYQQPSRIASHPISSTSHSHPSFTNEFRVCQPSNWDSYVCQGKEYDAFADKFEQLVRNESQTKPTRWGRRLRHPFPANSTILAVGNSHTRQVVQALICQYSSTLVRYEDRDSGPQGNVMRRGSYYLVEFSNGAILHLVTNHALFYSRHWARYLQDLIGMPNAFSLAPSSFDSSHQSHPHQTLDVLIVGKLNGFAEAYNTSFMEMMSGKTSKLEDADFTTIPPPTLVDFAAMYPSGPIVAHSMFADWGGEYLYWEMVEAVQTLEQQEAQENALRCSRVKLVNGRQYIPALGECSSNQWQSIGICEDDATAHRCIGSRGGHPDLIAWDIIEAMWELVLRG